MKDKRQLHHHNAVHYQTGGQKPPEEKTAVIYPWSGHLHGHLRSAFYSRIVSAANIMTALRLLLVPFIVYWLASGSTRWALWGFIIAAVSDGLDGLLARTWSLRTHLGTYLDPLADKLLLMSLFMTLTLYDQLPVWLAILVVTRDSLIICGIGLFLHKKIPLTLAPTLVSKLNTVFEMCLVFLVMLRIDRVMQAPQWEQILIVVTVITLALSAYTYGRRAQRIWQDHTS